MNLNDMIEELVNSGDVEEIEKVWMFVTAKLMKKDKRKLITQTMAARSSLFFDAWRDTLYPWKETIPPNGHLSLNEMD